MGFETYWSWLSANSGPLEAIGAILTLLTMGATVVFHPRFGLGSFLRREEFNKCVQIGDSRNTPLGNVSRVAPEPGAIAVMPFDTLSGASDDAFLAHGISCEVAAALTRAGCLKVTPRTDSFALGGKTLSLAEIGKQLRARYVVTGGVLRDADNVRVIAEFADSVVGKVLWSKTYDRRVVDVLKIQAEIAEKVATSIGGETFRAEVLRLPAPTGSPDAWSLTQRARRDYMLSTDAATTRQAVELVRQALTLDPSYAVAHALLAQLLTELVAIAAYADAAAPRAEARNAIETALVLGGNHPEVLTFASRVWFELGERGRAVSTLRQATAQSPLNLIEWGYLARALAFGDRTDAVEACVIAERILSTAPEHPVAWTWELFKGIAHLNLERYEDAVPLIQRVVTTSPKFVRAWLMLASALGACGELDKAREAAARSLQLNATLTPEKFSAYVRTLSNDEDTYARLTLGLRKAELLAEAA